MYKYKCLNPIAAVGLNGFSENYVKAQDGESAEIILVRSAKMHDMEFDKDLLCIARAGAGVNNIPLERAAGEGIVVFNTPGANANGVKELFVFAAIASVRDIIGGIEWTRSEAGNPDIAALTEKEKKKFVGNEILGKKLGVIGLGAIGAKVANTAVSLGMKVAGYDAFLNDNMKANLDPAVKITESLDEIAASDMITIHVPATADTKGMINAGFLSKTNDGVIVINLARDSLVNEADMKAALESGKVRKYVCDFPTAGASDMPNTILIPHLGASTEESEDNCAVMAVSEVTDFIENGNIKNSVNYPAVSLGALKGPRACVAHKADVAAMDIAAAIKELEIDISDVISKTRGDYAYTLFDISKPDGVKEALEAVDGVLKVRVL